MKRIGLAGAMLALALTAAAAGDGPPGALKGEEIKSYFSGTRIYGTTPSGKTWLIDFNKDGTFVGVVPKGRDVGKWWIEGNTLCRKWTAWENQTVGHSKKQACFHIVLDHKNKRVNYFNLDGSLYRSWRMGG